MQVAPQRHSDASSATISGSGLALIGSASGSGSFTAASRKPPVLTKLDSSRTIEAPAIIGSIRELEEWSRAQESPRPIEEASVSSGRAADGDDSNHHVRGYAFGSVEDIVYGSNQNSAGLPVPIRRQDSGGLSTGEGYSAGGEGDGEMVMRDLEEEQLLHPLGVQPGGESQLNRRLSHLDRYGKWSRRS